MRKTLGLMGLAAVLCAPVLAGAQAEDLGETDHVLTIEGRIAADQAAARKIGYDDVSIGFTKQSPDKMVWIGIVRAESWDGDAMRGKEMLDNLAGFTPTMLAAGNAAGVAKLQSAPVGSRVVVQGILDQGSRLYALGLVTITQ
jgi:hypothetical protein